MKNNLHRRQAIITECNVANNDFMQLYQVFTATLRPDMSLRQFTLYYYSKKLEYIDATFMYDGEQVVGFCAAAFYASDILAKPVTIGRSAIGFLENYQGKTLPKWMLYYKYIRYKNKFPFKNLILTVYVANPIVYSMICRYTAIVYPRWTGQTNQKIDKIKEEVLFASGLTNREAEPFVVKINFDVQKGEKLMQRICNSTDKHVQFFIKHTGLKPRMTLLVIIPITWQNIMLTSMRFIVRMIDKSCKKNEETIKLKNKRSTQNPDIITEEYTAPVKKTLEVLADLKKTRGSMLINCRNATNLAKQYFNKANKQTANGNWKRMRTLFTK